MPEGDVVWRTAQRLHAALAGRLVTTCDLRWPSLATVDLTGRPVVEVVSAGKHLLCRLGPAPDRPEPLTLHSHLRMDGSWYVHRTGEPFGARSEHGIRAILGTTAWTAVGHRLGMLDLVPTAREASLVGHLGPDLLGPGWDGAEAARRIGADPARPIGEALLDQRVLAGVGTFYLSEALFLHGITPWTPVETLSGAGHRGNVDELVDLLHRLLRANRDRAVQITTGDGRPGRTNYVHGRSGRPCLRCTSTVRVAPIGRAPADRVVFYCPSCQVGPAPTDGGHRQAPLGAIKRTRKKG
ncbi:MAG: DNA-formamidopyrimidine glycosylase family protein [Kineosporiaceae bacterium]